MKRLPFAVNPYRDSKRRNLHWVVIGRVNGKRQRSFFESEREAKTFAHLRNTELVQYGADSLQTPTWLRLMASDCQNQLAPFKKTIQDATSFYVRHLEQCSRSCEIGALFDEVAKEKESAGFTKNYVSQFKALKKKFLPGVSGKMASEITTRDVDDFLVSLPGGNAVSKNIYRSLLLVLFKHAKKRAYSAENPAENSIVSKAVEKPVGILRPDELARLLAVCCPTILPAVAIGAFAGLRTAELCRLDWREINLQRGFIEVTAKNAKSSRRRLVKIEPCLDAWLRPLARESGSVTRGAVHYCDLRKKAMFRAGLKEWPKNALRHSFASYHIAHFSDAAKLALQMGHTTTSLIFAHYREVVHPETAAEYWQIAPFSRLETASIFAFTAEAYPSHLKVFRFEDEWVDSVTELGKYFGVNPQTVYYWLKNPNAPDRGENERPFNVSKWRRFVEKETRTKPRGERGLGLPFFVTHSIVERCVRKYFATEKEASEYAEIHNAEILAREVKLPTLPNVVAFNQANESGAKIASK